VAVVVAATLLSLQSSQPAGVFWDDGVYLITARALATGEGYTLTHLPGSPPAVHFPPLWPALLAPIWRAAPEFPVNLAIFGLVNPLLAAAGAGLACAFGMRRLRLHPALGAAAATLFALTLPAMVLSSVLFAEPLFLVLVIAALFAAHRAESAAPVGAGAPGAPSAAVATTGATTGTAAGAIAGAIAGAATLARSAGLALVAAVAVALVTARRTRAAAAALCAALVIVAPWHWWSAAHATQLAEPLRGNYGPYVPWVLDAVRDNGPGFVFRIVAQNAVAMQRAAAVVFFPVGLREVRPLLVTLLVVLFLLGALVAWRRARVLAAFLAAYALLVLVWPYAPDRFAWAVWPLVGLVLAAGVAEAGRFAAHAGAPPGVRAATGVLVAVGVLAGAGLAFYSARGVSRGWVDVAQRRNAARLLPVVDWVRAHTPADAVVACDGEPFVHLYTGRRTVPVHVLSPGEYLEATPLPEATRNLRDLIVAGRARYAVLSAGSAAIAAAGALESGPTFPRLVPVDTLPGGGVAYRVHWQE
jgi:hypothetical protein